MNLLAVLLPLLAQFVLFNYSSDELFERGVLERKNAPDASVWFAKAAERYQTVWKHRKSRDVALMWARSSYLSGDNPTAIAAFRAGLQDYPADTELLTGLRYCRAEAKAIGVTATPTEGFRQRLNPRQRWAWAAIAMSFLAFGVWNRFTVRWRTATVCLAIGILGLIGFAAWEWKCERERNEDRIDLPCVVHEESVLRTGNGETYPPRLPASIPAGTEVRRVAERGGWVQIRMESGEIGWLTEPQLLAVQ